MPVETISSGCDYTNAEFSITVTYEGHNSLDQYSVVGTVPGADGTLWVRSSRILLPPEIG